MNDGLWWLMTGDWRWCWNHPYVCYAHVEQALIQAMHTLWCVNVFTSTFIFSRQFNKGEGPLLIHLIQGCSPSLPPYSFFSFIILLQIPPHPTAKVREQRWKIWDKLGERFCWNTRAHSGGHTRWNISLKKWKNVKLLWKTAWRSATMVSQSKEKIISSHFQKLFLCRRYSQSVHKAK